MDNDTGNEITIFVFRLLVLDLLSLFQVLNQAMINILGKICTLCITTTGNHSLGYGRGC